MPKCNPALLFSIIGIDINGAFADLMLEVFNGNEIWDGTGEWFSIDLCMN